MIIFADPVSGLQAFGYSIALGGLIYYKLGGETMKGYLKQGSNMWADYGARHPAMRKVIIFGGILTVIFMLLGGSAPFVAPEMVDNMKSKVNSAIGDHAARS